MLHTTRSRFAVLALLVFIWGASAASVRAASEPKEPRETGIIEETGRRLGQLDVTVSGPEERISNLTAEDFELVIGGNFIESFIVDRACNAPSVALATTTESAESTQSATPPPPVGPKPTYLFYFDQHHLTPMGRQNALDTARTVVDQLVRDGARAMIVSAGNTFQTTLALTEDRDAVQDALDRLERDNDQWDVYAYQEDSRIEEVMTILQQDNDLTRALGVARRHQREERYRTDKALRLFEITVGRLADLDPPKAVLYFSDTMRKNAGEHYVSYFPRQSVQKDPSLTRMETDAFMAHNAFDRVVETAAAYGVRLYTIQAEGLLAPSGITSTRGRSGTQSQPNSNKQRRLDAQDALVGLARETGGRAFLHGAPGKKIGNAIAEDLSCLYLISFDITGLPQDSPLSVNLRTKEPAIKAQTRGQIVLASEGARKTTRILAAFTGILPDGDDLELEGIIIPTAYEDGQYKALVQIRAPAMPFSRTTWEIGASLVSRGRVREDVSAKIEVDRPAVPVIFETEISFRPGPFELVMVAHERTTDQIARATVEADWPDPDAAEVTLVPFALIQPAEGAFLRDGELRRSGSLGVGASSVELALPTAVIGLVCREKTRKARKSGLIVERKLIGDSEAPFIDLQLSDNEDRCIQLRDIIRAGTMTAGRFTYELRVVDKEQQEISTASFEFAAGSAAVTPASGI